MLTRHELRQKIGCKDTDIVLFSVGELNENKNHALVIKALAEMNDSSFHYVIAGKGKLQFNLLKLAQDKEISDRVHLLGFKTNIVDWYNAADIFVALREMAVRKRL